MSKTLKLVSPIDGSVYAERPVAGRAEVEQRLAQARQAQRDWANQPLSTRVDIVKSAISALRSMNDQIVTELAWSMGRPIRYGGEIGGVEERAYHMADIASDALAPIMVEDSESFSRYILREPAGLVFVMAPWNYPYLTAINTIAPALIAGNAVVLKHATQTLLTGERFEQAF
ncbi:MAG: aldehyde dehydrogenase family protein, partial [Alphaproteobacteria bacterium]|nr:aldehyde dehydrogenase family protein [Alphaproteobacteria bacterium]